MAMPNLKRIRYEIVGSVWSPDEHGLDERFGELAAIAKRRGITLSRKNKFCASVSVRRRPPC